jgi:hypothetical protein
MKFLIGLVIVVGLALGVYQIYEYWGNFKPKDTAAATPPPPQEISGDQLPGMLPSLEPVLQAARRRGAPGLHDFLTMYGNTIADPRRAWIELDYTVLVGQSNPGEARREFAKVRGRVQPGSPVYDRVKQLESTYE